MNQSESIINKYHTEAMDIAETAFLKEKREKDATGAQALYKSAFVLERKSAMLLLNDLDNEPSRSVLFQSAAHLARKADLPREAERMVYCALMGNPPHPLDVELKQLLRELNASNKVNNQTEEVSEKQLSSVIDKLPRGIRQQVLDFVNFLLTKNNIQIQK